MDRLAEIEKKFHHKREVRRTDISLTLNIPESPAHVFWASLSQPMPHIVDEITIFGPNVFAHRSFVMIRLSIQFNVVDNADLRIPSVASFPCENQSLEN